MANQFIPVVQVANEFYSKATKNGVPEKQALDFARKLAGGHGDGAGIHSFSDQEIREGRCFCAGCNTQRGGR